MNVYEFPKKTAVFQPVGQFVRLGELSYRKVADLAASGSIRSKRFVADASKIKHLKDIVEMLQSLGAEIVLDPRTVELSSRLKCGGLTAGSPWSYGKGGEPLAPDIFLRNNPWDVFGKIARCAVENKINAVLSPSHYLSDPKFNGWYKIDIESCQLLREALDREGGADIAIDYLLVAQLRELSDKQLQSELACDIGSLPIENLWIRASMTSPDQSPTNAQSLVRTLARWHNLGVPLVMDYVGGLSGEALLSMNVVSAVAHGFGEKTSFVTSGWQDAPKERSKDERRGRASRIGLTSLGRTFTAAELEVLLSAHGAKTALLPNDRRVIPNGIDDLLENVMRFNANESERRFATISETPTALRPENFAGNRMREVVEAAKKAARLNPNQRIAEENKVDLDKFRRRLLNQKKVAEQLRETYEKIALERGEQGAVVRALAGPRVRGSQTGSGAK